MRCVIVWLLLASPAAAEVSVRPWSMARPAPQRAPHCPPRVVILNQPRFYGVAPQAPVQAAPERPAWTSYSGPSFGNAVTYSTSTADLDAPIRYVEPLVVLNPFFRR